VDNEKNQTTDMRHMLCRACGMSATIVVTDTGLRAWDDHMETHEDPTDFEIWTWGAVRLPFEP